MGKNWKRKLSKKKGKTNPPRPTDGKSERIWKNNKWMFDGK